MATASNSRIAAPQWVNSIYAQFPLVTLEQEDVLDWRQDAARSASNAVYSLWISAPIAEDHPHQRPWASGCPVALRVQLLFLLRGVNVDSRVWANVAAAPSGKLPALHLLRENRLVAADDIRSWLDAQHPLKGPTASLHGMPTQAAYDNALATAQLVLVRLWPAYIVSMSGDSREIALMIPGPPPLSAGLTTPLPASFTGDERFIDEDELVEAGIEALEALRIKLGGRTGSPWAHGASSPTPLDALLASHLYCIYGLPASSALRVKLEQCSELGDYVDSVLDFADKR
ncbi:hypothetical protein CC85DRAFT_307563 [Cutaneotrichosporon oleaginosum]|uniref:Metaxin glutathione S-transferase domain-containing protein n=1 Tax=Cutaneotrichosporon oleaginosum TaxID=879819 RepID=A0A0J0XR06_9TREE|nr:uncharacterized protein CC85DRAFT_307563 [Cutaneotrichosporon oleaginosum]KLT43528.1 hypothetical protein CC85DRAFT_307563 [Cutaneotrichosporon oleaginosum]TXT05573.1 hypothetical protein COLE_06893 [Cutaneotrichosporon oleaginosum]